MSEDMIRPRNGENNLYFQMSRSRLRWIDDENNFTSWNE